MILYYGILTSETCGTGTGGSSNYTQTFTYDHNENRLSETSNISGSTVTSNYVYDSHDNLLSAGAKSYTYNKDGDCLTVTTNGLITHLSYDSSNRVIGITYPGGTTSSFTYNGNDLRTSQTSSSGTFHYTTDGTSPGDPVLADGSAVYTPGLSEHRSTGSSFYHADGLGSTRGLTNSSGSITDSVAYDAFGEVIGRSGTTPTPALFAGKAGYQADSASGLMLLGFRYYDPSIGRFLSSDPAQAGTNWYAYCENNPLGREDTTGLDWKSATLGGLATVGVLLIGAVLFPVAAPTLIGGAIIGGIAGMVGSVVDYEWDPDNAGNISWGGIGGAAEDGGISGAITGGLAGPTIVKALMPEPPPLPYGIE